MIILDKIRQFPVGYAVVTYKSKTYGVTRTDFNSGKSFKIFAKELGGNDFISLNYYITQLENKLKPCEMPAQKVIDFLKNATIKNKN